MEKGAQMDSDRIHIDLLGAPRERADQPPLDLSSGIFTAGPDDTEVRLALTPSARWIVDYYPVTSVEETGDGGLEVGCLGGVGESGGGVRGGGRCADEAGGGEEGELLGGAGGFDAELARNGLGRPALLRVGLEQEKDLELCNRPDVVVEEALNLFADSRFAQRRDSK